MSGGETRLRPIRVCHVITMLELGGAQRNTLHTVAHLDRAQFAPSLIAGPGGLLDDAARRLGDVPFEICPALRREIRPWADAAALVDLWRRLRRIAPDIVHTHSSKAGIVGRWAALLAGAPVIVHTVHGWGFHPRQSAVSRAAFVALERWTARITTQLIAVAEANVETGVRLRIAPRDAFTVIRSGAPLTAFRRAARSGRLRAELGLPSGAPLIGMVACLKPQKAPLDFVAAAQRVRALVPQAHFVLAGDGALRPAVEQAVAAAGLADCFHLLGWRGDPEIVIGDLDVLALTSLHEGLPRVAPEAMAAQKPVVATAVDGTPEAVRDGVTGFLHRPGDVAGLADSIARLVRDPELARRLGKQGAAAAGEWEIELMVRRQEELYAALAAVAGLPRRGVTGG